MSSSTKSKVPTTNRKKKPTVEEPAPTAQPPIDQTIEVQEQGESISRISALVNDGFQLEEATEYKDATDLPFEEPGFGSPLIAKKVKPKRRQETNDEKEESKGDQETSVIFQEPIKANAKDYVITPQTRPKKDSKHNPSPKEDEVRRFWICLDHNSEMSNLVGLLAVCSGYEEARGF